MYIFNVVFVQIFCAIEEDELNRICGDFTLVANLWFVFSK